MLKSANLQQNSFTSDIICKRINVKVSWLQTAPILIMLRQYVLKLNKNILRFSKQFQLIIFNASWLLQKSCAAVTKSWPKSTKSRGQRWICTNHSLHPDFYPKHWVSGTATIAQAKSDCNTTDVITEFTLATYSDLSLITIYFCPTYCWLQHSFSSYPHVEKCVF